MRPLLFTTLFTLSTLLASAMPTYAQTIPIDAITEATSTTLNTVALDPLPLATTTSSSSEATGSVKSNDTGDVPGPVIAEPVAPAPKKKKATAINPTTSTATTTPFVPPALTTEISDNIYKYASHPPLSTETTQGFLAVAALSTLLSSFMVQKRLLERMTHSTLSLFSPRSLPQPQAKRQ